MSFSYISQATGLTFDASPGSCPRLSVLTASSDRGVVHHQFLSLYQSDMVLLLCRTSQEAVLQRSGHTSESNHPLWSVEALKVVGMSG